MADENGEGRGGTTQRSAGFQEEIDEERNQGAGVMAAARGRREDLRAWSVFFRVVFELGDCALCRSKVGFRALELLLEFLELLLGSQSPLFPTLTADWTDRDCGSSPCDTGVCVAWPWPSTCRDCATSFGMRMRGGVRKSLAEVVSGTVHVLIFLVGCPAKRF